MTSALPLRRLPPLGGRPLLLSLVLTVGCGGSIGAESGASPSAGRDGAAAGSGPSGQAGAAGQPPGAAGGSGTAGSRGAGAGGNGGASTPAPEGVGWSTRFPRLTHVQWENTTRDLLRLDAGSGLSARFTPDEGTQFDTQLGGRKVATELWTDYQTAAESLAATVARDATKRAKILPAALPNAGAERAQAFVRAFGRRAFRRSLTEAEVTTYAGLFDKGAAVLGGDALASGVELVLRTMLQSPHFLYRIESATTTDGDRIWLGGFEFASRLSYALWNTMPSDGLLDAALAGELATEAGRTRWVGEMLDDPRAQATLLRFHEQLYRVSRFGDAAKDPNKFPTFTNALAPLLQQEARAFLDEVVLREGAGVARLLTAPFAFVSDKTAPFYGLAATGGAAPQKVALDPKQRAGLFTQVGFLSKYGALSQSDPIHRGVAVNFDVMCRELPPPPDEVLPLPAEKPGQTNRQRIATHTDGCGLTCHKQVLNPIGFAFESFDTVGAWRDTDNGQPVDVRATALIDGVEVTFDGAVDLLAKLAQSAQVHDCYAQRWFEYTFGRSPSARERGLVTTLAAASRAGGAGASAKQLLARLVSSPQFRARPATEEGGAP